MEAKVFRLERQLAQAGEQIEVLQHALTALVDDMRLADWYNLDPGIKQLIAKTGIKTRFDEDNIIHE